MKIHRFTIILILLLAISFAFNIATAVADSNTPEPGSEQDPVVSKSYVDEKTNQYMAEIAKSNEQIAAQKTLIETLSAQVEALKTQLQNATSSTSPFALVSLEVGQQLTSGEGSELILVSGKAVAISGSNGGLLIDTTSAKTLTKNTAVIVNHMLVSAKDDGRGIKATAKSSVLVKGAYKTSTQAPAVADPVVNKTIKGKVNTTTLNVRAEATTDAKSLAKLSNGAVVEILGTQDDWYKIKTASGITGWAMAKYITKQ